MTINEARRRIAQLEKTLSAVAQGLADEVDASAPWEDHPTLRAHAALCNRAMRALRRPERFDLRVSRQQRLRERS